MRVASERPVADGVHAAVNQMETAGRETPVDRVIAQPKAPKLIASNRPVLAPRNRRDRPLYTTNPTLTANIAANVGLVPHIPRVTAKGVQDMRTKPALAALPDKEVGRSLASGQLR
jgi:hypothetical protein